MPEKNKVLITGVAGFIGSNLAERLIREDKYQVIGIDNLSYGVVEQVPEEVEFHQLDIRDEAIYHVFQVLAKNSDSHLHQPTPWETRVVGDPGLGVLGWEMEIDKSIGIYVQAFWN